MRFRHPSHDRQSPNIVRILGPCCSLRIQVSGHCGALLGMLVGATTETKGDQGQLESEARGDLHTAEMMKIWLEIDAILIRDVLSGMPIVQ